MKERHTYANGWTASVIDDGYGGPEGFYEVWAWNDKTGETDPDVQGWLTRAQVDEFLVEVERRGTEPVVVEQDEVDHALRFGKLLAQACEWKSGERQGVPAVSLLDIPTKGCFIAHAADGVEYLVEFTRLGPGVFEVDPTGTGRGGESTEFTIREG